MTWAKGKQLSTMTNGEQTLSFKYDANGIRTKKTVNNVEYEYTYVGDKLVRVESNKPYDDPLTIYYTADGNPHSFIYGGGPFYYMLNLQGDVIGIATDNGNVIVENAYDSWGKPISVTVNNSIYEDVALANPLRYRGYVYDSETELYYLQSRYYDPELCRFISADSYLVAGNVLQGTNMFAYCLNNPVRYSDPSGYSLEDDYPATYKQIQLAVNLGIVFGSLNYFAEILSEDDLMKICNKYVVPNKNDLEKLSQSLLRSYIGMLVSGVFASLSQSGSDVDTLLGFTGIELGKAGYYYSGMVGVFEIISVAFDPSSSMSDIIYASLKTGTDIMGGVLAGAAGAAVSSVIISSGGTGILPIFAAGLTTLVVSEVLDYIIENI